MCDGCSRTGGFLVSIVVTVMTFVQVRPSHEAGIEKTQVLPPTQPMDDEGTEEAPILATQASALAGVSHGVETQVLRNMFDGLPPSSQIVDSEMLGWSHSSAMIEGVSFYPTDLETQVQSLPREESIESFTADQPMKVDSIVPDRGLDCCCEVNVRLFSGPTPGLTQIPQARRYRYLLVREMWALVSYLVRTFGDIMLC
jgi:hypothetical protein